MLDDPSLLRKDPYGKGWLVTVHVPDEENTARNMVPKGLVRSWMRESVERLYARSRAWPARWRRMGGVPPDDLLAGIPGRRLERDHQRVLPHRIIFQHMGMKMGYKKDMRV